MRNACVLLMLVVALWASACGQNIPTAPTVAPVADGGTIASLDSNEPAPAIRAKDVHTWSVNWTSGTPHGDPTIQWDDVYGPPPISAFNHAGHGGCTQICMDASTATLLD